MLIAVAALRRCESRGAHFRSDFPAPDAACRHRRTLTLETALQIARETADRLPERCRAEQCFAGAK
jgi:L-aspartate oxidase